jgi:hypothetical protein
MKLLAAAVLVLTLALVSCAPQHLLESIVIQAALSK